MTSLQVGLIIAGIALVVGVIIYNWVQERRVRTRLDASFGNLGAANSKPAGTPPGANVDRVEPTFGQRAADEPMLTRAAVASPGTSARPRAGGGDDDAGFELPVKVQKSVPVDEAMADESDRAEPASLRDGPGTPPAAERVVHADGHGAQPDPEIECIIAMQPSRPVAARALGEALDARLGKRLRWFGRRSAGMPWQLLRPETAGELIDIVACLLLADRAGAASAPMLEAFVALVTEVAPDLPATVIAPQVQREAARAESLDRLCAEHDVQIGLTVLKESTPDIPGTRLRGVAEAAGFRLAGGRFEWVQEESGATLYALQNFRAEPFTPEHLRTSATPGAVFLLDVPRVADPARVFDHMKMAAKRMAHALDAALVDDNRRPLDDHALTAIRNHVAKTAAGLQAVQIEPGSPRAMALFGG
ncbi:MAG: cell division protein ZipA C-terminal FtsZ-binding domain-containing protein [Casimicrobiaceae bacterium]